MSSIKKSAILHAVYYFILKGKKRILRCVNVNDDVVSLSDEDTGYTFDMRKDYFLFRLRTASWRDPTLPKLNETAPYFTCEDLENFRRAEIQAGERNVVTFATEFNSSEEFEKSITWLLSATSQESEEIKRRNDCYDAEELYAELLYFFDFPKSRTEQKKQKLIKAHNVAFNVMLDSRGPSWFSN